MIQNKRFDASQIKKVPSLFKFNFNSNLHPSQSSKQIQFFLDTLQSLETAFRSPKMKINREQLIKEMLNAHLIYDDNGLNFFHWLVHYTQNFGAEHLAFFKFLHALGVQFDVYDANGYHLLDQAILQGNIILINWLLEEVKLDIDDERWEIHPLVRAYNKYQKNSRIEQFIKIEDLVSRHLQKKSSSGNDLLMMAVRANDFSMAKWILELPKYTNALRHKNQAGKNALMYAIMYSDDEIVEYLINKGANLDEQDLTGRHMLHYFASCGYLKWILEFERRHQIDLRAYKDDDGCCMLFYAVQSSNLELVQYLTTKNFEISHEPGIKYSIPLNACKSKNVEIVKWMQAEGHIQLYHKIDDGNVVWLVDDLSRNALLYAASGQSYEITKWLIEEHGADIEYKDIEGANALLSTLTYIETEESYQVIEYLMSKDAKKVVKAKCPVKNDDLSTDENFIEIEIHFSHALILKSHFKTLFRLLDVELLDVLTTNHLNENIFDAIIKLRNPRLIESMRLFLIAYNLRHIYNMINPKRFLGYPIFAEYLVSQKYISLQDYDPDGDALIHSIIKYSEISGVVQYLSTFEDLNVNYKTEHGESPLSLIVSRNNFELFKEFIKAFSLKLNFAYINSQGQHLLELLKEDGKQEWINWMSRYSTVPFKIEEHMDLCFEVFEEQAIGEVLCMCLRMDASHWAFTRKKDHKKPLAILIERFSDQEILQILQTFGKSHILTKLNGQQENLIELLRLHNHQFVINEIIKNPILALNVNSLLSEVCQKESRTMVLEFCKAYTQVDLNIAVGFKSPLMIILERQDDDLLKKFILQFYGKRLHLERIDHLGRNLLDYLLQEKRTLLNWFSKQKDIAILPLSDATLFEECAHIHMEKSDWQRYLFSKYIKADKQEALIKYLMVNNHPEALVFYLKNNQLSYDFKDMFEQNILILALLQDNPNLFERLLVDFYMGHRNTGQLIKDALHFYKNHPTLLPQDRLIQIMLNTHDKSLLEFVVKELNYDWRKKDNNGHNLFDVLYQSNQMDALEWLIRECEVGLNDTHFLTTFKEKSPIQIKSFFAIFRRVYKVNDLKQKLIQFNFEVAEAVISHLDTVQALNFLREFVHWHQTNSKNQSLLHVCVLHNRLDILPFILEYTIDLLNHQDCFKRTALHHAVALNFREIIEVLMTVPGIQLQLEDGDSQNILHLAIRYVEENVVFRVLSECPQLFFAKDALGHTPIQDLIAENVISEENKEQICGLKQHVLGFFDKFPPPGTLLEAKSLHFKK